MKLIGIVGAALCALVVVSTFVTGAPRVPLPVVMVLAFAAVPLLVLVGMSARQRKFAGLRGLWQALRTSLPVWAIGVAAVAFYGAWLLALVTVVTGPGGAPEIRDGKYVLVNRNKVTEVSREVHDRAANQWVRVWACIGAGLHTGGAVLIGVVRTRPEEAARA